MKSLSILLLLATLSSILIGALFAVTPTAAGTNSPNSATEIQDLEQAPDFSATDATEDAPVAELQIEVNLTESEASPAPSQEDTPETSQEERNLFEPGAVMSVAFTTESLQKESIPETGSHIETQTETAAPAVAATGIDLVSFIESVSSGSANQVTGVYADGALALRVGQQPNSDPAFITGQTGEVTQFGLASTYGSLGLLGHNYLSGGDFFSVSEGQIITLVYGDGRIESYQVQAIRSFEALQPNSVHSNFVDLDFGGQLSASDLFRMMYDQDDTLVLQTCIANHGISTWGRLFVVATPLVS